MNGARWKAARERKVAEGYSEPPVVEAMRTEIRMAFDLGQAVDDRRTEPGISQTELASRSSNSATPSPPFPCSPARRRTRASLNIALGGDTSTVEVIAHAA